MSPARASLASQSTQQKLLMVLIAAGSCFRVLICLLHNPMNYLASDMLRHWNNGVNFPRGGFPAASDPIVFQAYVSVLHHVTHDNRLLIGLAFAALSVLMPWTYYRAARNFGLTKTSALWAWVLIAWTPSLLVVYHFVMMETLLLFLEGIALWMTARYLRKGGAEAFLLLVITWTLASLTKPTVAPFAAICFLYVWWKKSTPLRDIAIATGLAVVLLVPSAIRSKVELGFVAPFGNPWLTRIQLRSGAKMINVHYYMHGVKTAGFHPVSGDYHMKFGSPSCFVRPLEPVSHWAMRRAWGDSAVSIAVNGAHGQADWKQAYESFNHDWSEWLAQWRENIILFFFSPSWPESGFEEWDGYLEYLGRWLWAPLIAFVLVANAREFLRRRFDLIPVAVTLFTLLLALQNVVITEGRYRKPLEPLLLLNLVWSLSSRSARSQGLEDEASVSQSETSATAV